MSEVWGIPVVRSELLPPGRVLIGNFPPGFLDPGPVKIRRELGWRAEIRQIVRDGMADVLAWLGENAPPELPDEEQWDRWRILAEQRVAMTVADPRAMVRGITGL